MGKTAIVFPGQGSQIIGMGKELFKQDTLFRSLINLATELTGEDLESVCLNGPDELMIKASNVQPLVVSVSLCYYKRLFDQGVRADFLAGHSLGEISAFAAAGIISFEEAVRIAVKRGKLMDEVASSCNGGMMAVMFLEMDSVQKILSSIAEPQNIVLANDNAPCQAVLSGEKTLLERFAQFGQGKNRFVPVAGPWHSPFMESARVKYQEWVEPLKFSEPGIPVILNATAQEEKDPLKIRTLHTFQLTHPVRWRESMNTLKESGVDTIFEVGPRAILLGLARANGFKKGTNLQSIDSCNCIDSLFQNVRVA